MQLYRSNLIRRYPYFFAYLVFAVMCSSLLLVDSGSDTQEMIHMLTAPVLWVLATLVVLELYFCVLDHWIGIRSIGMYALTASLVFSAIVSVVVLSKGSETPALLFWSATIERTVRLSLLIQEPLMLTFFSRYPLVLKRNVVVHGIVWWIFFLTDSLPSLIGSFINHGTVLQINNVVLVISSACLVAWALLLTREGEIRKVPLHRTLKSQVYLPAINALPSTSTVASGKKNQRVNPPRTLPPSSLLSPRLKRTTPAP